MQVDEIRFPIAETFYSIQGEGLYAGTPMFFIRLAGCNVGKPFVRFPQTYQDQVTISREEAFQILQPEHTTCTSFSGKQFICDTDYRVKERLTIKQLCDLASRFPNVSITGGEPLIHKELPQLVNTLNTRVHIETSGTISLETLYKTCCARQLWITCSPKKGFIANNAGMINQYKFLVESQDDVDWIESCKWLHNGAGPEQIFIQSIERYDVNGPVKSSYDFVVDVVKKHPNWRLSLQLHKILGVR